MRVSDNEYQRDTDDGERTECHARCGREMVTQNHYRTERQTDSNEYTADMPRKYASNHVLNFFQKIFHNRNFLYCKYLRVMNR